MTSQQPALRLTEIFHSLQGESSKAGVPTTFIRLTGCPLRCRFCDTTYAFNHGEIFDLATIMAKVKALSCSHVCVSGGEPLAQPHCTTLLTMLCNEGYKVSLETSGAQCIKAVDKRVMVVMDLKTPGSEESHRNRFSNLEHLKPTDQIKFVICHRDDYDWACHTIKQYALTEKAEVLFSPSWEECEAHTLANWILEDKLDVRFQVQLHKILWNDAPGR